MNLKEQQAVKQRFGIIGNSQGLNRAIEIAVQVAPTDLSVLITGESGVGKENFPQIIHHFSHRKHAQYIAVNCGAIPEGTIDSELFGHEKGAFTGASTDRKGYFEVADGGTIFLDEVGELPLATQVRLLRVLESGEFIRVGSSKVQKTDVRIVAATNVDINKSIQDGKFREDLYYRLNTVPIAVLPLRKRREDIFLLFRKFAYDFSEKYNMPPIRLSQDAQEILVNYYWPGNIRQLKNVTEQISVIEQQREIGGDILKNYLPDANLGKLPVLRSKVEEERSFNSEREILYQVLFDMKKDINDLKKVIRELTDGQHQTTSDPILTPNLFQKDSPFANIENPYQVSYVEDYDVDTDSDIIDVKVSDDGRTLADAERDLIIQALERHNGRRRPVAKELNISERTLYRKIKEYNLDGNKDNIDEE